MGLEDRIDRLERKTGGDCPRCSGVFAVVVNGRLDRATRHGEAMSEEEWEKFEAEEEDGRCPVCGRVPITVGIPTP